MGARYSRRAADGTIEYHDSKDALVASARRENNESRAFLFGLIGLLGGGVLTYVAILKLGAADWSKPLRFGFIIGGATIGAFTFSKLANIIWNVLLACIGLAVLYGIGSIVWNALG